MHSKILKQYFTPDDISNFLTKQIEFDSPKKILDLCMGEGSLLRAARSRWPEAGLIGNDIDERCIERAKKEIAGLETGNFDIASSPFINNAEKNFSAIDICLGNPPYKKIENSCEIRKLLEEFDMHCYENLKYIPLELVFTLLCIKILKHGGILAVILPDGLLVNEQWKNFRRLLLGKYNVWRIVELPSKTFAATEAKTHIMFLSRKHREGDSVILSGLETGENLRVPINALVERADYTYYRSRKNAESLLGDIGSITVKRGSRNTYKTLPEELYHCFLHTTHFKNAFQVFESDQHSPDILQKYCRRIAGPGDILIPRVGTRSLGKVGIVKSGYFAISDCLFAISAPSGKIRSSILRTLNSRSGADWIKSVAKGVAARHITIKDIWQMPILYL